MLQFNTAPSWYWLGVFFLFIGVVWLSVRWRTNNRLLFGLGLGLLVLMRLPLLLVNIELNPDESQLLSQALTLLYHPVYWKSVDGATMGPLSCYFAAIPGHLGLPLTYSSLRVMALLCLVVSMVSTYFSIENFFGGRVAQLALVPSLAFFAFTTQIDYVHATNEQLSLALIGLATWQYSRMWARQTFTSVGNLFWLGFVSSLVPFAKLQGTPTVLVLVVFAFIGLIRQYSQTNSVEFWRALAGLFMGGLLFPALVVGLTLYFGVFIDLIQFYIIGNFAYSNEGGFAQSMVHFPTFLSKTTDFAGFLLPTAGLVVAWSLWSRSFRSQGGLLKLILALLVASGYAVIKPGNEFTHYLLYLILPITLLNAWLIANLPASMTASIGAAACWILLVLLPSSFKIPWHINLLRHQPVDGNRIERYARIPLRLSSTAQAVLKLAQPGEDLVVWGWAPRYNVETQMPQGVSDNHTIRCVMGTDSSQRIHRARYLRNIQASRPPVFLDAVGPNSTWLNDRSAYGYENFPELKQFIDQHYQYVGDIAHTRLYARLDRLKSLPLTSDTHVDQKRTHL
ncbi:MAG: hypothetical protein JWP57_3153 [Spirosoma sp.]|nr:hypothetical protein [Spirosoma sp.]